MNLGQLINHPLFSSSNCSRNEPLQLNGTGL